jgi:hypothetical protein
MQHLANRLTNFKDLIPIGQVPVWLERAPACRLAHSTFDWRIAMQSITRFQAMKAAQQKISMVTCYDFWSAQLVAESAVDSILVGDSLAVVMHGFPSTVHATLDLMLPHDAVYDGQQ